MADHVNDIWLKVCLPDLQHCFATAPISSVFRRIKLARVMALAAHFTDSLDDSINVSEVRCSLVTILEIHFCSSACHFFYGGHPFFMWPFSIPLPLGQPHSIFEGWPHVLLYFHQSKQWYGCQRVGFSTCTQIFMHLIARRSWTNTVRNSAMKAGWEKNPLLHQGVKPASTVCWTQHWITELHPHSHVLYITVFAFILVVCVLDHLLCLQSCMPVCNPVLIKLFAFMCIHNCLGLHVCLCFVSLSIYSCSMLTLSSSVFFIATFYACIYVCACML